MNPKATITLAILMFGGLGAYWWTQYAKVPTVEERRARSSLILPELADIPTDQIGRIEIAGGDRPIVIDRQGKTRWELVAPSRTLADSKQVESLLASIYALRKSFDAGSLSGDPAKFGLDKPERVVRLFDKDLKIPVAELEVGKVFEGGRYVRARGKTEIEVADARALEWVSAKSYEWREQEMFTISPLDVASFRVIGSGRDFEASRDGNRWRIERPIRIPADENKIVAALSDLAALRVMDPPRGFAADDVKDWKPYGLDKPRLRIELKSLLGERESIEIGSRLPDRADRAYARRSDQDDVVIVNSAGFDALGVRPIDFRSPKIAGFDKEKIGTIEIQAGGITHLLSKNADGVWEIVKPETGKPDANILSILLGRLASLETNDVLSRNAVGSPGFDKPLAVWKLWRSATDSATGRPKDARQASIADREASPPVFELVLGRHDATKKIVYSALGGDPETILPLPDNVLELIPGNRFAFRDRSMTRAVAPGAIARITIRRGETAETLKSSEIPGDFERWRLIRPVDAPVDPQAVALLAKFLSDPHAYSIVAETIDDPKKYGFDQPHMTIEWTAILNDRQTAGSTLDRVLTIGSLVPNQAGARFATVTGSKAAYTFSGELVRLLESEWRQRVVLRFVADRVRHVELVWSNGEKLEFDRDGLDGVGRPRWKLASKKSGGELEFDPSRLNGLLSTLSATVAIRFVRHDGTIPDSFGLKPALLTIRIADDADRPPAVLRVGLPGSEPNTRHATNVEGDTGPVFLLPEGQWSDWIVPPGRADLPANPFGDR